MLITDFLQSGLARFGGDGDGVGSVDDLGGVNV